MRLTGEELVRDCGLMMFLCQMKYFILVLLVGSFSSHAQKEINKKSVNELELNTPLSQYETDLRLITGEEEIYENYPNLKENVKKNIANGIREGLYGGYRYNGINGIPASRTTLFFYKDELYKVRWFFQRNQHPDLQGVVDQINGYLTGKYGEADGTGSLAFWYFWRSKKRFLQSFFDEENEFQIEYRDEKIHKAVEKLK